MPSHLKSFYASKVFSFRENMKNLWSCTQYVTMQCDMQTLKDMHWMKHHTAVIQGITKKQEPAFLQLTIKRGSHIMSITPMFPDSIFANLFHIIWSPWFSLVRWGWKCEDKGWWGGGAPSAVSTYAVWGGGWGGRSYKYHPHFGLYPSFGYLPFEDTSDNQ